MHKPNSVILIAQDVYHLSNLPTPLGC